MHAAWLTSSVSSVNWRLHMCGVPLLNIRKCPVAPRILVIPYVAAVRHRQIRFGVGTFSRLARLKAEA